MSWFAFLNPDEGASGDAMRRSPRASQNPRDPEGHARAFMQRFAEWLTEAAATFNQTAPERLEVETGQSDGLVQWLRLRFNDGGYAFTRVGKGTIRVERLSASGRVPEALLRPKLNGNGKLHSWREQQLSPGGQTLRRAADELYEHYLLSTVRPRSAASA